MFTHIYVSRSAHLFAELLRPGLRYRSTGVVLQGLEGTKHEQLDLFGESFRIEKMERLFQ